MRHRSDAIGLAQFNHDRVLALLKYNLDELYVMGISHCDVLAKQQK